MSEELEVSISPFLPFFFTFPYLPLPVVWFRTHNVNYVNVIKEQMHKKL